MLKPRHLRRTFLLKRLRHLLNGHQQPAETRPNGADSEALAALLGDSSGDRMERQAAAHALGQQQVEAPLIIALRDPSPGVRAAAAEEAAVFEADCKVATGVGSLVTNAL